MDVDLTPWGGGGNDGLENKFIISTETSLRHRLHKLPDIFAHCHFPNILNNEGYPLLTYTCDVSVTCDHKNDS